jgi:hypothetical protein
MSLLADLDAFYLEHRRCGELKADVWDSDPRSFRVWMVCSCGASLSRLVLSPPCPLP